MKQLIALVLITAVAAPGCAARGPALSRATTAFPEAASGAQDPPPDVWRRFAGQLPVGTTLRIRTQAGERFTGVLLVVGDTGITVSPRTRIPEPMRAVPYTDIAQIEPIKNGAGLVKAAAIGAGVGGATFLGMLLLMFAAWSD